MRDAEQVRLGEIADIQTGPFGSQLHADDYQNEGTPIITVEHLGDNEVLHSNLPLVGEPDRKRLAKYSLKKGDIVFSRVGVIDRRAYVSSLEDGWLFSGRLLRVRAIPNCADPRFLSHKLGQDGTVRWIRDHAVGSTMPCLNTSIVQAVPLDLLPLPEQRQIAEILDTVDEAIRKTEEIIVKLKQVKQGLLHDLLTRGIDENGELRDPERHPEQFKDSPLGRIPKEWEATLLEDSLISAVDGPFGSNLKTEHYVEAPGVRVVRLQNLGVGEFLDHERSWVSERHAARLGRHEVRAGDLLVACLGDPTHPFARSCPYPPEFSPGIVKADCFRLRPNERAVASFLSHVLNTPRWRKGLAGLVHRSGVSRDRINLGKLKRLLIPLAPVHEQEALSKILERTQLLRDCNEADAAKLRLLKQGLMEDLLTGRVRVTKLLKNAAE